MLKKLATPRWMITTLLVLVAVGVMARLGFWQLSRLDERRAFNERVQAQIEGEPLDLPADLPADIADLYDMEYRPVSVTGVYDPEGEILLRNQVWEGQPGYHLLTPLRLAGTEYAILVDRGFIAMDEAALEKRAKYRQPGEVRVSGILLRPRIPRYFGAPDPTLAPGQARIDAWNALRLDRIQSQAGQALLPVYLQAAPDPLVSGPPFASVDQPDLSEGPHMGYALQWFSFAAILAAGYPFFVRKQLLEGDQQPGAQKSTMKEQI